MPGILYTAFHPPAKLDDNQTSLAFTDILFGFVIWEVFQRLRLLPSLPTYIRLQLAVAAVLVLGSWIGYRRSFNRTSYQVKFFNLPFFRFVLDQVMILMYFRVAIMTQPGIPKPAAAGADLGATRAHLAHSTIYALLITFAVYLAWDFLGMVMIWVKNETNDPKYPEVDTDHKGADWPAFWITLVFTLMLVGIWSGSRSGGLSEHGADALFTGMAAVLIAYRWAKEIKNSRRYPSAAHAVSAPAGAG